MRILITGSAGFVGRHVVDELQCVFGADAMIIPTALRPASASAVDVRYILDVTDPEQVHLAIRDHRPTHVLHLAGIAVPKIANANPRAAWTVHVNGTRNIGEAILRHAPDCWLLNVGSSSAYGNTANLGRAIREDDPLSPIDEYGASKAAAEMALCALSAKGLKCMRFRPFNHTGLGQTEAFAIPSFAKQIARIEAGVTDPIIRVGNLEAERDFLDVRDVVACYVSAITRSAQLRKNYVFNVASGYALGIGTILQSIIELSTAHISIEVDPQLMRPLDIPRIVGNAGRAREILGWRPKVLLRCTIEDLLSSARAEIGVF